MSQTPSPLDFLDLDRLLSEEERLIRDTTRSFVTDRVLPEVAGWFERGELPRELAKELGDLGLLGMHLQGYGCAGTNAVSYGLACLELEAVTQALLMTSEDHREFSAAFTEGRSPTWRGR